jgi:hypothetical protein
VVQGEPEARAANDRASLAAIMSVLQEGEFPFPDFQRRIKWTGWTRIDDAELGRTWMYPTNQRLVSLDAERSEVVAAVSWTAVESLVLAPPYVTMTLLAGSASRFVVCKLHPDTAAKSFYKNAVDAWHQRKKP